MTAEELNQLVAKSAISPIHFHATACVTHVIKHPELVLVSRPMVVIAI
jgi:hypothetical protein